jgi:hypothetical protein
VQRDNGFSGARPALDNENSARVLANDAVLVGLDGGDNVAHPPGPAAAQRRQQRGLAGQVRLIDGIQVEHVVVQAHDPPVEGMQVAAAGHAVPLPRCGAVERLRRTGTPVDQQQVVIVAAQAEPADVEPVTVVEVQAAEAQVPFRGVKLRGTVLVLLGKRLALRPPLVVLRSRAQTHRGQPLLRNGPQCVQPLVQYRQVRLLVGQLGRAS